VLENPIQLLDAYVQSFNRNLIDYSETILSHYLQFSFIRGLRLYIAYLLKYYYTYKSIMQ
jgi:hypothetical protein